MAYPTLEKADEWLIAMLKETEADGIFGTEQRYRAIYLVANRIQSVTRVYKTTDTISLVNGTTSYDLTSASYLDDTDLTWDRIDKMWITGYDFLIERFDEDQVRIDINNSVSGRPEYYVGLEQCTLLVEKDPDTTYTLNIRYWPEIAVDFDSGSPSDVSISIPSQWLYNGLNCGAWFYLTNTRKEYGFGQPGGLEFESWLTTLKGNDHRPLIARQYNAFGLTGQRNYRKRDVER